MNEYFLYGYESPITAVITSEITKRLKDEVDREVFSVIQNIGISVDKDELIKALTYDRGQYERGFFDGRRYKPPVRTNGDSIRAKTNEELADWFCEKFGCPPNDRMCPFVDGVVKFECNVCWQNWINEVVTEDA